MLKKLLRDNRGFLVFLALFGVFRTAVADWNPIPSGSMRPTIVEGDVVLVNRLAYDLKLPLTDVVLARLGEPARGDIATFTSPRDGTRLIKRIVALPGDVVAMRDGVLHVNGEAARYDAPQTINAEPLAPGHSTPALQADEKLAGSSRRVQFLPRMPSMRDFDETVVPADHVMALGDNRDNSLDSRYYGFVPRHLLIGRAHHVLVSGELARLELRMERIGLGL